MKGTTKKLALASAIGLILAASSPVQAQFVGFFAGHGLPGLGSPLGVGLGGGWAESEVDVFDIASGATDGEAIGAGVGLGILTNNWAVGAAGGGGSAESSASASSTSPGSRAFVDHQAVGAGIGLGITTLSFGLIGAF